LRKGEEKRGAVAAYAVLAGAYLCLRQDEAEGAFGFELWWIAGI